MSHLNIRIWVKNMIINPVVIRIVGLSSICGMFCSFGLAAAAVDSESMRVEEINREEESIRNGISERSTRTELQVTSMDGPSPMAFPTTGLLAQAAQNNESIQDILQDAFIGDNSNNNEINLDAVQNNTTTQNIIGNDFRKERVRPLDRPIYTPVNTENDFGFNLSAGVNTLDASNFTLYLGVIFQPGRTASHRARMAHLRKQTDLLDIQRETMEAELALLRTQVEEAELKLQQLRQQAWSNGGVPISQQAAGLQPVVPRTQARPVSYSTQTDAAFFETLMD